MDEPTTFLDLAHQIEVLELLRDLNAGGVTIVMVLHDLNQAARSADQLVAVKDGSIVAYGRPARVMTQQLVQDVFGMATHVMTDPVSGSPLIIPLGRDAPAR